MLVITVSHLEVNGGLSVKESFLKITAIVVVIVMLSAASIGRPQDVAVSISTEATSRAIPAAEVWSDNFDDEDISDWQLFVVNHSVSPDTLQPGNSTAVGGALRHIGVEWSYAGHNSTVAYGTWIFDVDIQVPEYENHFTILFASEIFNDDWLTRRTIGESYAVVFYLDPTVDEIKLGRSSHSGHVDLDRYFTDTLEGWRNIIVTREPSGQFYVYLDGDLILKGKDTFHTTSKRFYFLSHGGPAIDNVSVSDAIDYDAAPPEWVQPISDQMIDARAPFYYDLNATDYSGIDQWSINNTENFAIDNNGVISNTEILDAGLYNLEVQVNDSLGNTQVDTFRLIVRSLPSMIPVELLIGGIGVTAVVIIVLVVWIKKK